LASAAIADALDGWEDEERLPMAEAPSWAEGDEEEGDDLVPALVLVRLS
jgi:hypothetical protein